VCQYLDQFVRSDPGLVSSLDSHFDRYLQPVPEAFQARRISPLIVGKIALKPVP